MSAAVEETPVVVVNTPKRDLHRMQRIFRSSGKSKLTTRPFHKVVAAPTAAAADDNANDNAAASTAAATAGPLSRKNQREALLNAISMATVKAYTAALTADEIARALADAEPIPAVVAEMSARAARFGVAEPATAAATAAAATNTTNAASSALSEEEKAARAAIMAKRAQRFGTAANSTAEVTSIDALVSKIDPTVLAARASRFADPRAEAEKEAAAKRSARFGTAANTTTTTNNNNNSVAKPAPVELTEEQKAALEARARRFGAAI